MPGAFPPTRWSLLQRVGEGTKAQKDVWENLASTYWKPVFAYVRTRFAPSAEEAHDEAAEFFVWMFESDFLERADPERGRFRAFVKVALPNFFRDRARMRSAQKRGGRQSFVPWTSETGETFDLPDVRGRLPEEVLD